MAKSKQTASSTKSARAARKGGAAGKKSINPSLPGRAGELPQHRRRSGVRRSRVVSSPCLSATPAHLSLELIAATGWLPHTTRAALTGLRHKGFVLDRDKRADGTTVYRISSAPAASSPSKAG